MSAPEEIGEALPSYQTWLAIASEHAKAKPGWAERELRAWHAYLNDAQKYGWGCMECGGLINGPKQGRTGHQTLCPTLTRREQIWLRASLSKCERCGSYTQGEPLPEEPTKKRCDRCGYPWSRTHTLIGL